MTALGSLSTRCRSTCWAGRCSISSRICPERRSRSATPTPARPAAAAPPSRSDGDPAGLGGDAVKIATWNVNSIKVRLGAVCGWLQEQAPDVLLLQEIKTTAEAFPRLEIEALGYHCAIVGQRAYNGVAILSRHPIENPQEGLPGDADDDHARYIEATIAGIRVASIYLPNGNP